MDSYEEVYNSSQLDKIKEEFTRLEDNCYLDHTGATLYSDVQIEKIFKTFSSNVYGNPHAYNISSKFTGDCVDQIRFEILEFFNTTPEDYSLVFISNATAGLKIVAEHFTYKNILNEEGTFIYLEDNHTSVIGMREYASHYKILPHEKAFEILNKPYNGEEKDHLINSLFAYPAQCNFSGTKYPLSWIKNVQNGALNQLNDVPKSKWYCMLDTASYIPTNKLDLNVHSPDFVCVSFYKVFGYPTGVGALLIKNSSANVLQKKYFGGGTVKITLPNQHVFRDALYKKFEDGTVPFLSILALKEGFDTHKRLSLNMDLISNHVFNLAKYVHHQLLQFYHSNGNPVAILYHDTNFENILHQGGIVNFNLLRDNGEYIGYSQVLEMANLYKIHLRTGCLCNPGACRRLLNLSLDDVFQQYEAGHVCGDQKDLISGYPTGSCRISFGYMTTKSNADKFLQMIKECFVTGPIIYKIPKNWTEFQKNYLEKFSDSYTAPQKIPSGNKMKIDDFERNIRTNGYQPKFGILKNVYLYPVKSCGSFSVENNWPIDEKGLKFDREWMVVTTSGICFTQKREPKLCRILPKIDLEKQVLELHCEGFPSISIPLDKPKEKLSEITLCQSKVCGDRVQCYDCGDEVSNWLNNCLDKTNLRLYRQSSEHLRISNLGENSQKSLANMGNYLLLNIASVKMLAQNIPDFKMDEESLSDLVARFRANFIVDFEKALVENDCNVVQIGDMNFKYMGPCTRCHMICIDQKTGEKTVEPLKTLSTLLKGKIRLGIYLSAQECDKNCIHVGEKVVFK